MIKLLRNNTYLLFCTAALLIGCGKESSKEDFAVRVNKTYLKSSELDSLIQNSDQYKNELIRNWINNELLYQQALKEGIPDTKEFLNIIENSKKELAVSMWIDKYLSKKEFLNNTEAVEKYYEEHKSMFLLDDDAYLVNLIKFSNENSAIKFRAALLESNWTHAVGAYKNNTDKIYEENHVIKKAGEINPAGLERILQELNPSEVSIVFKEGNNSYYVLQLINKFAQGTIPSFDFIRTEVEKRYVQEQREIALRDYLQELYSNNDIEIRTGKK